MVRAVCPAGRPADVCIQLKMEHELASEHRIKAMRQKVAKIKARPAASAAAVSLPAACPVLIIFNCSYFGVKSNHGSASAGRLVRQPASAFRLTAARFRCVTQKIWRTARMQKRCTHGESNILLGARSQHNTTAFTLLMPKLFWKRTAQ